MMQQLQQHLLLQSSGAYAFPQLEQLKFLSQQSQQLTQVGCEELTASSNELESYCAGRSKQNTIAYNSNKNLNSEFDSLKKNKTFLKLERKNRDKKEAAVLVTIPQENTAILQMLNFPSKFLNPLTSTYRLTGDIIINEEGLKASLGLIENSLLMNSMIPIISSINLYKTVTEVAISKNSTLCNVYFRDLGLEYNDWRYVASRFESFGNSQFKKIADLIRKLGEKEAEGALKKINYSSCDSSTQLCNTSVFSSPCLKSETIISPLVAECPVASNSSNNNHKKNGKNKIQGSNNELKSIETEIAKSGKDSLSYTFHFKGNTLTSLHFSKNFLEKSGWEISQFSMFCLYNGLPELISHEDYFSTVVQMLSEKLNYKQTANSSVESQIPQVYFNKVGQKFETSTKYSVVSSNFGVSIINQIINIKSEVNNKKNVNAPPQKVRGRKHFSQIEQNTLEYNLECPLNEMDRHQRRVCKFRVLHNKSIITNLEGFMHTKTQHNFFEN